MLIKLCHANNGNLIEEFSITKFEDLENKIYGYNKDLMIYDHADNALFGFDALENSPNGEYSGPTDPGRFWSFLIDEPLNEFLIATKLVNSRPDDKKKETEECWDFIKKHKLDDPSPSQRELAKRFINLFL